jgi:hypothetical protein
MTTEVTAECLLGVETECLTALGSAVDATGLASAVALFLETMQRLAPSLPGPAGFFNAYGRVYVDGQHLEFASAECDSPYALPLLVEQQQHLAALALARLRQLGLTLVLANNNHDGWLQPDAATWGAHENYLVEQHPRHLAEQLVPFLISRVFAVSGGVLYPAGEFVAGVRSVFMRTDIGGGTVSERAIHSLARDEHHLGPASRRYRYHLVLGDGHRSHFSLALQFGSTALAIKAVLFNPDLIRAMPGLPPSNRRDLWLRALRLFNTLAAPGDTLRVHPLALTIQRLYLDGARRFADSLKSPPSWVPRLLDDWETTLARLTASDHAWLAARLDPWIKYELFSICLREQSCRWQDVPRTRHLFDLLALLDQRYHEFADAQSPFNRLDEAGGLWHRIGERLLPGTETEPYVPATTTRARARARFFVQHRDRQNLVMDWAGVYDTSRGLRRQLDSPFGQAYGDWQPISGSKDVACIRDGGRELPWRSRRATE